MYVVVGPLSVGSTVGVALSGGSSSSGSRASGSRECSQGYCKFFAEKRGRSRKGSTRRPKYQWNHGGTIRKKREGARCIHTINITPRARFNDSQSCRAARQQEENIRVSIKKMSLE